MANALFFLKTKLTKQILFEIFARKRRKSNL